MVTASDYARIALLLIALAVVLFAAALVVALGWFSGNFDALLAGGLLAAVLARLFE